MRNWNFYNAHSHNHILYCFYSTYEELKLFCWGVQKKSVPCFYSTYEELKPRNRIYCWGSIGSFYSTYEELKHRLGLGKNRILYRFYSTYEELKLTLKSPYGVVSKHVLQYLWELKRWSRGYGESPLTVPEELKPHSKFMCHKRYFVLQYLWGLKHILFIELWEWWYVFTVPMRNWNILFSGWSIQDTEFLQYLWGIETWRGWLLHTKIVRVFTVPMRNWNIYI